VTTEAEEGHVTLASLAALYEQRYRQFLRLAEAIVGDVELAHDVVQEAFARAIRSRGTFRGEGSVEGWVWRTVVNAARNARRDRSQLHLSWHEMRDERAAGNGSRTDDDVQALVASLAERQRLVLFLRYYADLDYEQIAEVLEIRPGTVGATLNQAHAALRRRLEEVPR
jgi:RNA polymerase sigma factor (sigma-70 family)